ncbi:extracellular solute-binding protein [Natronoarchaeum mannanilyticum]|uniref:ABC transporter substrate-binding protein n=1 Tax=Natronoarchaeum mannanilyticum TaxID=926360 RepID=A0AAV3TDR6_9EURY
MREQDSDSTLTRRRMLQATGAAGAVGFAGCLSNVTDGGNGGGGNTLEVLHGWTGGDGQRAINALTEGFKEAHSDVDTDFRPIGGGGNTNLNTVVSNRLSQNDPPSSFAGWPGANLQKYDGVLGDLSDVWEEEGFTDSHLQEAVEACQYNDQYAAVPIGSHRLNCLFYNTSVVEDAGVDPDSMSSIDDLITAMDTVASETDATPMAQAMKAPWTTLQLFGVVLLGQEGYDSYMTFVDGEGGGDAVRSALETTSTILSNYISDDASQIGLTGANEMIMNGEAAFIHNGNWAAGAYRGNDLAYDEDWGFVPFPGTEGMYTFHLDSFIYPGNNPSPEATKTWMRYVGGTEAQVLFNTRKGSIPTRTDVPTDEFGPYLTETIDDFQNADQLPPTLAHGLAVSPNQLTNMKSAITENFTGPYDVEATATSLLDIAQQ